MYGRYGVDDLYKFLLVVYIIMTFINIFLKSHILIFIEFLILSIAVYRVLSKKIASRRRENQAFLNLVHYISIPFVNVRRNIQDKNHIYKRCSCGTTLKLPLPKKYGIKHAKCPNCKKRLAFWALKKEKVVIISQK